MPRQFHRPARLDNADALEGSADIAATSELAHRSAQALVGASSSNPAAPSSTTPNPTASSPTALLAAVPSAATTAPTTSPDDLTDTLTRERVVALVASAGVDEIAELWADSPATTLPGTLWRLFLLREWIRRDPELVARRYATIVDLTHVDAAAQARAEAALKEARRVLSAEQMRVELDRLLAGEVTDPLTLARITAAAAHFLEALAVGSSPGWIDDDADELADHVTRRDSALRATAEELTDASRRAQSGRLD